MPRYLFYIDRADELSLRGVAGCASSRELKEHLRQIGLGQAEVKRIEGFVWPLSGVDGQARIVLLRQLAFAFNNGVSLTDTFFSLKSRYYGPAVAGMAMVIGHSVAAGMPLSRCLSRFPKDFPPIVAGMLKAAEASGSLGVTLERCADLLEERQELRRRLRSVMVYPASITLIFTLVLTLFALYIVPVFVEVFASFGVQPPVALSVVAKLSQILTSGWAFLFALQGLMALGVWGRGWLNSNAGRGLLLKWVLDMPVLSRLYRDYLITQFCLMMKEMLDVGVDLVSALRTCSDGFEGEMRNAIDLAVAEITHGERLSVALASHGFFPPLVSQLVAAGEETGKLVAMFSSLYRYHQQSFRYRVDGVLALLEPLIIGAMGLMVAGFVVSMVGPMFNLFQVVGG